MKRAATKASTLLLWLFAVALFAQTSTSVPVDTKASILKWTGHAQVGGYAP